MGFQISRYVKKKQESHEKRPMKDVTVMLCLTPPIKRHVLQQLLIIPGKFVFPTNKIQLSKSSPSAPSKQPNAMPPASISLEELSDYFHMPEKVVAQKMGMCLTSLKKVCRGHGITRWPFRKLKSIERTMQKVNADSSTITAQLGVSGAQAARVCRSSEASRAPSPMKLNGDDTPGARQRGAPASHATQAAEPRQAVATTPGTPKPAFSPKAESAVRDSARSQNGDWPSFSISGVSMQQLVITNWSSLWTVYHLNKHIVKPLGCCELTICEDGTKAYLTFNNSLSAVQARKVCEEACDLLTAHQMAAQANKEGVVMEEKGDILETLMHSTDAVPCGLDHDDSDTCFMEPESETDAVQPGSMKVSPSVGPQHVPEDEGISWTLLPSMPGQPFSTAGNAWVSSVLGQPHSCGPQSFGSSGSSAASDAENWISPCLVSC
jgi:hypothetical protein